MGCYISEDGSYHEGDMLSGDVEVTQRPMPCCVWSIDEWIRGVDSTLAMLKCKCDELIKNGYLHTDGHTYQIREDPDDLKNFALMRDLINAGVSNPHGGVWRDIDNNMVALDDDGMHDLALKAPMYAASVKRAYSLHKDAINALTDAQSAEYDIETGWPVNV